jgi:methionyl-tRNA formyltransferase
MCDLKICLFAKRSYYCDIAIDFVKQNFSNYRIVMDDLSSHKEIICKTKYDYIISFLYTKLIPDEILRNARVAALNFHTAPPEYPGTGCYNFALYNDDKLYGTTCHHMIKKVDSGKIVSVKRFPVYKGDTVESLRERTMIYTIQNFYEIMNVIVENKELPLSNELWKREPYTRKDLNKLLELNLDMQVEEIDKRIRATAHPEYPGPFIKIHGKKYTIKHGY